MSAVTNISRYQRKRERTKKEILCAAQKVLAQKGYHDTKIADIAAAADIGVGTFYVHFKTKDAVFLELVQQTAQDVKVAIDRAWAQEHDPIERVRAANRHFFMFAQENRDLFKIIFGHGNAFHELLRQVYTMFISDTVERVRHNVNQHVYRSVNPEIVANALVGMFAQVVSWWVEQDMPSAENVADEMTQLMLHGLVLAPPSVP